MKKIILIICLGLLFGSSLKYAHANRTSRDENNWFFQNQKPIKKKEWNKPLYKKKSKNPLLIALVSILGIILITLGIAKWYISFNNDKDTDEYWERKVGKKLTKFPNTYCPICFDKRLCFAFCNDKHPVCGSCTYRWYKTRQNAAKACGICRVSYNQKTKTLLDSRL